MIPINFEQTYHVKNTIELWYVYLSILADANYTSCKRGYNAIFLSQREVKYFITLIEF